MKKHSKKKYLSKAKQRFQIGLLVTYIILSIILLVFIFSYKILAFRYLNILVTLLLVFVASFSIRNFFFSKKSKKNTRILLIIFNVLNLIAIFSIYQFVEFANQMNESATTSSYSMSVAVLADSSISEINQLKKVTAPVDIDEENILNFIDEIKIKQNKIIELEKISSYLDAYRSHSTQ